MGEPRSTGGRPASRARARRRLLAYAWASPASLVGLAAGALACAAGARARPVEGTLEIAGDAVARAVARLPRPMRFDAITLGHVVIGVGADALDACRSHERVHVRQYERYGPAFLPLYLAASLLAWLRGRDPYRDNAFERQAYAQAPVVPRA